MTEQRHSSGEERISPLIRITSGILGVLGFAAIAFNGMQGDGIPLKFLTVAQFFAGFIFLYVAFFGKYPWNVSGANKDGR
ncbi:MAG: hypothetical protein KJO82_06160 [Gammaproteobacteria bacterium]|nr:hypothetical protein [Gammaproteobacteria bacterium]